MLVFTIPSNVVFLTSKHILQFFNSLSLDLKVFNCCPKAYYWISRFIIGPQGPYLHSTNSLRAVGVTAGAAGWRRWNGGCVSPSGVTLDHRAQEANIPFGRNVSLWPSVSLASKETDPLPPWASRSSNNNTSKWEGSDEFESTIGSVPST